MIYFLNIQQIRLNAYKKEIANQCLKNNSYKPSPETKTILEDVAQARKLYKIHTKSWASKILSLVPGTKPYAARVELSNKINITFNHLWEIKKGLDKQPTKHIKRSLSDPTPQAQPRIFPPLFKKPYSKDDLNIQDIQAKPIIRYPMRICNV